MARATRAKVSMTSGQGVSRLSYQKAYDMRAAAPKVDTKFSAPDGPRQYGKGKSSESKGSGINVDYEYTIPIRNLDSVKAAYSGKPAKSEVKLKHSSAKKYK